MRKLSLLILVGFFFLNPGLACGPQEPEFQYGAAEMKAAIEGDWSLTITPTGGPAIEYVVSLEQAASAPTASAQSPRRALVRAAHACGSRTLVASADACIDITSMPLTATLASGEPPASGTLRADFSVLGTVFTQGELALTIGNYQLRARINADGTVASTNLSAVGLTGTATLARL